MKQIVLIISLLIFYVSNYAQESVSRDPAVKWRQQVVRVNLSIVPQFEYVKIGGQMDLNISLSGIMTFNNKLFFGGFLSKKPLKTFNDYSGIMYDVSYQQFGILAGQNVDLGLYRTDGGHYVKRKTKLVYSLKLGGGAAWLVDESGNKATTRDYFYIAQINIGATRPISKFINVELGGFYVYNYGISLSSLSSTDFSSPGAYIAFKFNLFR